MRDKKKKKERKKGAQKKGGENSPISPPLDPRLVNADAVFSVFMLRSPDFEKKIRLFPLRNFHLLN